MLVSSDNARFLGQLKRITDSGHVLTNLEVFDHLVFSASSAFHFISFHLLGQVQNKIQGTRFRARKMSDPWCHG